MRSTFSTTLNQFLYGALLMLCLFVCSHSFNQCFISYIPSENQPTIAKYVFVHNISDLLILFILILHFIIILLAYHDEFGV